MVLGILIRSPEILFALCGARQPGRQQAAFDLVGPVVFVFFVGGLDFAAGDLFEDPDDRVDLFLKRMLEWRAFWDILGRGGAYGDVGADSGDETVGN
jgi:hypothetical protein